MGSIRGLGSFHRLRGKETHVLQLPSPGATRTEALAPRAGLQGERGHRGGGQLGSPQPEKAWVQRPRPSQPKMKKETLR